MRAAPLPASLFTRCPSCGASISARIPAEDRTCPTADRAQALLVREVEAGHLPTSQEPTP